ncbi:MAG: amidohydrolase family protein [Planctomycetes bacterium]|nr:amidohydrolase family protein [Planctomycetota bacterium]
MALANPTPRIGEESGKGSEALFVRAQKVLVRPGVVLEDSAVLVTNGKITAIGKDLAKPEGARELTAKVLCAGFIDAWGALGLGVDSLRDGGTGAATRAADGVDAYSDEHLRRETLRAGVTSVRVQSGTTSRVSGIGALVRVAPGLSVERSIVLPEAALAMSIGLSANASNQGPTFEVVDGQVVQRASSMRGMDPFDRLADVDRVTAAIESGRSYLVSKNEYKHELEDWQKKIAEKETELDKEFKKAKKDREKEEKDAKEKGKKFEEKKYKEDKKPTAPRFDDDSETLARVANGDLPLVVLVHRHAELRGLLSGTEKQDRLRLVLEGASEALAFAEQLSARNVPVILAPALNGKGAADELEGSDLELPARLQRAGVSVLFGSGGQDPAASRDLPLLVQMSIGHGFEREAAFDALTLGAARVLDAADRIGSIERGKDADLLLLDGDPLTSEGRVRFVISAGRLVLTPEG